MRSVKHVIYLLMLASLTVGCDEPRRAEPLVDFNATELIGAWVDMWNSYDLSKVDELFLPDSTLTYFSSEKEGIIRGIDAVREHHRGFGFVEGGIAQANRLWMEDIQVDRFGTSAIITGIWFFQRSGEKPETPQRGPATFIYVLREGEYYLAHLNFAEYMTSEER